MPFFKKVTRNANEGCWRVIAQDIRVKATSYGEKETWLTQYQCVHENRLSRYRDWDVLPQTFSSYDAADSFALKMNRNNGF